MTGVSTSSQRQGWDHVAEYLGSTEGTWYACLAVNYLLSCVKLLAPLRPAGKEVLDRVSGAVNVIGLGLSVPASLKAGIVCVERLWGWQKVSSLGVMQSPEVVKSVALAHVVLLNRLTDLPALSARWGYVALRNSLTSLVGPVYHGTSLVLDVVDLWDKGLEVQGTGPQAQKLAFINLVKVVSSLAGSCLALLGLAWGLTFEGSGVFAVGFLGVNCIWIAAKLYSHFYRKMVFETSL